MTQRKNWVFTVTGTSMFPVDMLRYDACFPDHSEDAITLAGSCDSRSTRRERKLRLRSMLKPPTMGRWESFGWTVTETREFTS
jgi:hypothetical protein